MNEPFFPTFLDKGSSGRAVKLLQFMLLCGGYNPRIIPDGDYGAETAQGVRNLQESLGFTDAHQDGNFGPQTRRELLKARNIDINAIPGDAFLAPTVAVEPSSSAP